VNAIAPAIMEWASVEAYDVPSVATVSPKVASATDGAAPNSPAKVFGFNRSPMIANADTLHRRRGTERESGSSITIPHRIPDFTSFRA